LGEGGRDTMKATTKSTKYLIGFSLSLLLLWAILACSQLGLASTGNDQKKVLVIYSSREDAPYTALIETACRKTLSDGLAGRLDYYPEYVDLGRFSSLEYQEVLRDFLRRKYSGRGLDVIIAEGNAPLEFISRYGAEIFPGVPLVFSTEEGELRPIRHSTGLVFQIDMKSTLDLALRLQPNIKRLFVVTGASDFDKFYERIARQQFQEYEGRVTISYLPPMPLKDLLQEAARLPKDSIIYFVSMFEDGAGEKYIPVDVLDRLSPAASVPVYCWPEMAIDHGIVGGSLLSEENVAQQTASLALRVLRGEDPDRIPIAKIRPYVNEFNWRQLRRWGISESRLPFGSIVRFKELTLWEQYKARIIIVATIIVFQSLLLVSLLVERRRKRRTAERLAKSEERFAKAFKANPQPMSVTTLADGKYLDVNESFLRMSGFSRDELIGHTSNELGIFQNPADGDSQLVQPLLSVGAVRNFEMKFRTKDGAFRTLLSAAELVELAGERCILLASSDITERKMLEEELNHLTTQLFRLQDDERRRIARDLHDGTAQNLFAISVNLAKVDQLDGTQWEEMHKLIAECMSLGDKSLEELRTLSYLLHPPLLEPAGLVSTLKWYAQGFSKRSGIQVDVFAEPIDRLPADVELVLFRVVQESLTNVRQHSGSDTARIRLAKNSDEIFLEIQDNGHGLSAGKKESDGNESEAFSEMGVGIPGMQQRLRQLGGKIEIDSNGEGTTITAVVPIANGTSQADPFP
jgi:PAS domain S-box-containing protein